MGVLFYYVYAQTIRYDSLHIIIIIISIISIIIIIIILLPKHAFVSVNLSTRILVVCVSARLNRKFHAS